MRIYVDLFSQSPFQHLTRCKTLVDSENTKSEAILIRHNR